MSVHPEHLKNRIALAIRIADSAAEWKIPNTYLFDFPLDGLIWTRIAEGAGCTTRPSVDTIAAAVAIVAARQVAA
jgi:hypothetical protein